VAHLIEVTRRGSHHRSGGNISRPGASWATSLKVEAWGNADVASRTAFLHLDAMPIAIAPGWGIDMAWIISGPGAILLPSPVIRVSSRALSHEGPSSVHQRP